MSKSNMKSVRLTDEVLKYVEAFNGDGFNQKFENLVLFCLREEKNITARLKEQKKTYEANEKRIELQRVILKDLQEISYSVSELLNMGKKAEVSAKGVQLKMQQAEKSELPAPSKKNVSQKASPRSSARSKSEIQIKKDSLCKFCVDNDTCEEGWKTLYNYGENCAEFLSVGEVV